MGSVNHQFGVGAETTYGTSVVPNKWYAVLGAELKPKFGYAISQGMVPGRTLPQASQINQTTRDGEGVVNLEAPRTGLGFFLQHMLGSDAPTSVQQATTTAYLQTFVKGGFLKNFTAQVGAQQVDTPSSVAPFTGVSCKVEGWSISVDVGGFVIIDLTLTARNVLTTVALATANYSTTTQLYSWENCSLKLDAVVVPLVSGFKFTGALNMPKRRHVGSGPYASEPRNTIGDTFSGSFTADFSNLTNWYDKFDANTTVNLEFEALGDIIASTFAQRFTVKMPACKLRGDAPSLSPGLLQVEVPFEVYDPPTGAPITFEYMSTDVTI